MMLRGRTESAVDGKGIIMKLFKPVAVVLSVALGQGISTYAHAQDDTAALYKAKCQICHGADAKGDTPAGKKVGAKDLHSPEVAKLSAGELFEIVKKGKDKMPAYGNKLTDDQIKALIKYVSSLK
jgi:mono/diheme cytochrome c family protein